MSIERGLGMITLSTTIDYYWAGGVATILAVLNTHERSNPLPVSLAADFIVEIQALIELAIDYVPDNEVIFLKRMLVSKLAQMGVHVPPAAGEEVVP